MENNKSTDYKIAAVVVTYNRLTLLNECVNALRNQTRKLDEIIVVNNSSTDGTLEWLSLQNDLTIITQENSGSAGGQYTGIKTAYEMGHDWIWCMDDDGYPECEALEKLIKSLTKFDFDAIGCLNKENIHDSELPAETHVQLDNGKVFITNTVEEFQNLADCNGFVWNFVNMFNGTLLSNRIVSIIGYPKRELVLWGDEVEYFERLLNTKLKIATNINALFFHPKNKWKPQIGMFNRSLFTGEIDWKAYYFFRNRAFLAKKKYRFYNIKYVFAQIVYFIQNHKYSAIPFFLIAYKDGLLNNFSKKYLAN